MSVLCLMSFLVNFLNVAKELYGASLCCEVNGEQPQCKDDEGEDK